MGGEETTWRTDDSLFQLFFSLRNCNFYLYSTFHYAERFFQLKCKIILEGRQRREWFINEETEDQFQLISGALRFI